MRILISGAGIAGPTLAHFVSLTPGARVTIVEKAASVLATGHNIDINGSAVTVIRKMGVYDSIKALNTTERGTQLIDPRGRPFAPFPVVQGAASSPTSELEILRGDLARVLYEATRKSEGVEYLFGTTIARVLENGAEAVRVELSNGEVREFDLLVAADGQWSRLRKECFSPDEVGVVDKGMYVVYSTIPRLPGDNDWWNVYQALRSRVLSLRPDPHGSIRAMFSCMPCDEEQKRVWEEAARGGRKVQQDLARREFADAGWQSERVVAAMEQSDEYYFQAIKQIRMTRWSRSRVVCLGDTAYAPTPLTGMGTSLALDGAYVLAGELSKLEEGEHPRRALEAYEKAFRPFVEEIQKIPFIFPGIVHPKKAWTRWIFQTVISTLSRVVAVVVGTPWLAKRFGHASDEPDFAFAKYPMFDR